VSAAHAPVGILRPPGRSRARADTSNVFRVGRWRKAKACRPEIRPRIAMGVERISIPLRKTTARPAEALRMMATGQVGAFSGCPVLEHALAKDDERHPLM